MSISRTIQYARRQPKAPGRDPRSLIAAHDHSCPLTRHSLRTRLAKLMKELLSQIFGTPRYHPKSQPFVDHVFTFSLLDHRIWFRNYQIAEETGALVEIGPRFVLNPIKVFEGSFGGAVIFSNPHYVTPSEHRRSLKLAAAGKYKERKEARANLKHRIAEEISFPLYHIPVMLSPETMDGSCDPSHFVDTVVPCCTYAEIITEGYAADSNTVCEQCSCQRPPIP
ncbi:hypothetical protein MRX96_044067 [Rhipicephalus microplus]